MFLNQHSIGPRWTKEWFPLATQQLRLRNLIKILALEIQNDKKGAIEKTNSDSINDISQESYYFTLHSTTMSAPFYTSEKLISHSPKWKDLEISSWNENICPSVDAVVIRLWLSNPYLSEDKVLSVWGIHLSGLLYLGPKLKADIPLKPNSLILLMPGGYFTDPKCVETNPRTRCISVIVKNCDVRQSYTVSSLKRLQTLQHVIKKEIAEAEILKKKISMGDFFRNETRGRTTLRKLLSKHKPKTNHIDLMRVKESIEITKYRINLLKEEKEIICNKIRNLNRQIQVIADSNKLLESSILEHVKVLKQKIYNHKEWKKSYIDRREKFVHSKAMLNFRKKQLISELNLIYPIVEISPEKFTICGVHLPNSEDFAGHDELQISVALGFVTHIIQMISVFLQIPLRYPVIHYGSRSRILDLITDKISDFEREFCLYVKGKEKLQFHYAVYLLNKNIAQMRWLCGLPTSDLRNTLENLSALVKMKVENSTMDQSNKSLSSSTADISNVSVSSPLDSVISYQFKKSCKSPCASESKGDFCTKSVNNHCFCVPKHQFSKSVGTSKNFVSNFLSVKSKNFKKITKMENLGNNNLSCSLDEGLNDFGENLSLGKKELDQFGSEPILNINLNSTLENSKLFSPNKLDKTWEADLSVNTYPSDIPQQKIIATSSQEKIFGDNNLSKDGFDETFSSLSANKDVIQSNDKITEKHKIINSTILPVDLFSPPVEKICNSKSASEKSFTDDTARKCDMPNTIVGDNLLENVTIRTKALVHHTTSFNRFRTRFKSTLESSN